MLRTQPQVWNSENGRVHIPIYAFSLLNIESSGIRQRACTGFHIFVFISFFPRSTARVHAKGKAKPGRKIGPSLQQENCSAEAITRGKDKAFTLLRYVYTNSRSRLFACPKRLLPGGVRDNTPRARKAGLRVDIHRRNPGSERQHHYRRLDFFQLSPAWISDSRFR